MVLSFLWVVRLVEDIRFPYQLVGHPRRREGDEELIVEADRVKEG